MHTCRFRGQHSNPRIASHPLVQRQSMKGSLRQLICDLNAVEVSVYSSIKKTNEGHMLEHRTMTRKNVEHSLIDEQLFWL